MKKYFQKLSVFSFIVFLIFAVGAVGYSQQEHGKGEIEKKGMMGSMDKMMGKMDMMMGQKMSSECMSMMDMRNMMMRMHNVSQHMKHMMKNMESMMMNEEMMKDDVMKKHMEQMQEENLFFSIFKFFSAIPVNRKEGNHTIKYRSLDKKDISSIKGDTFENANKKRRTYKQKKFSLDIL